MVTITVSVRTLQKEEWNPVQISHDNMYVHYVCVPCHWCLPCAVESHIVVSPVVSFELYVSAVPLMAGSLLPVPDQSAWEHCHYMHCMYVWCEYIQTYSVIA